MQEQRPLITTVIPTYRRPHMLRTAVRSVLSQTFEDFQVIVYDNASGDETAEVVAQLQQEDARVKYHCHPENIGMIPNFNYAIEHVTTPFFSVLSDDDLLLPWFYETALDGFQRYPDAASSSGTIVFTDLHGLIARHGPCITEKDYFTPPEGLLAWRHETKPLIIANMFRREVIPRIGPFSEKGYMDLEWEMRLVAQFPYVVSSRACALATIHDDHASKKFQSHTDLWWESYTIIEKSVRLIPDIPSSIADTALKTLKQEFGSHVYRQALVSISKGETQPAHEAAPILRDCYGLQNEAARLDRIARFTDFFGLARPFYKVFRNIRKLIEFRNTRELRVRLQRYREAPNKDFVL